MLVRQLEEELRLRMRGPSLEMQQQMEVLYAENEHLTREIAILRETIKVTCEQFIIFYYSLGTNLQNTVRVLISRNVVGTLQCRGCLLYTSRCV